MKLELSIQQWNYILGVLGQRPYIEVTEIIDEIKLQANQAMDANNQSSDNSAN
jgi:hypothetical protein